MLASPQASSGANSGPASIHVIHAIAPSLVGGPGRRLGRPNFSLKDALADCYRNILVELVSSGRRVLRLPPLLGAGSFSAATSAAATGRGATVQATTAGAAAANHDGDWFLGDDDDTTSHQASAAAMTAAAAAMTECGQEGSEEGLLPDEALAPLTVEALIQGFESLDPATQEAVNRCDIEVRVVVVV